jgi:hypothetical protein
MGKTFPAIGMLFIVSLSLWGSSSKECAQCHSSIVKEWETSAHAMAHSSKNELYAKMVAGAAKTNGVDPSKIMENCNICHAPAENISVKEEGVTCVACHRIDAIEHQNKSKPPIGMNTIRWMKENVMAGPSGTGNSPYHGIVKRPFMEANSDALCLACHNVMKNKQNITVCNTGDEHRRGTAQKTCIECHMGDAKMGLVSSLSTSKKMIRSHGFHGARNSDILTKAVDLKLAKKKEELIVTLTNLSSHNFPTGTGVRIATVVSDFYKGNVKILTQTEKLEVIFAAADGNITLPPMASKELSDTRLKPNEIRAITTAIPKGTTKAVVTVNYRLAKEQIVEKFQLRDERFKKVHLVASKTIKL